MHIDMFLSLIRDMETKHLHNELKNEKMSKFFVNNFRCKFTLSF